MENAGVEDGSLALSSGLKRVIELALLSDSSKRMVAGLQRRFK